MSLTSMLLLLALFASPLQSIAQSGRQTSGTSKINVGPKSSPPALSRFGVDLTTLARQNSSTVRLQHKAELNRIVKILTEETNRNPVLIGQAGEGNAADVATIAFAFARRIVNGNVPESLQSKQVYSLNLDKLAASAKDSDEFVTRLQSVLSETAAAHGQIILFVDQLHQFAGKYARVQATAAIRESLAKGKFQMIGAATAEAYASYIAADESLTRFFHTVRVGEAAPVGAETARNDKATREERGFVGEVISSDLRELMNATKSENDRIDVILQTPDIRDARLSAFLARNDINVTDRMAELGTMKVQMPVKAVNKLAQAGLADFLSPNVGIKLLGHVTTTTGTSMIRSATCLLGLVCVSAYDGTGIGVAILDSGIDTGHRAFSRGVRYSKDFTNENISTADPLVMAPMWQLLWVVSAPGTATPTTESRP